jgi:hypothetical protein
MYSTILSRQKNKAAHIFCTDFGFVRAFPMKKESEAHEALSLLFHRDGVPNVVVMDGAKAQIEGRFIRKLRDAGCHIKQTEPHTQYSNMGEGGVRELKRGAGQQMPSSGCPKIIWDDCIIREAYLRSHTSLETLHALPYHALLLDVLSFYALALKALSPSALPYDALPCHVCPNMHFPYMPHPYIHYPYMPYH